MARLSSRHLSVLGVILFAVIMSRIDLNGTLRLILSVRPYHVLLCLVSVALEVFLRSARWKLLVGRFVKGYGLKDASSALIMGSAFGAVTPGRVGDVVKAFDIRDRGIDIGRALSIEILDRLMDLFFLLVSAFAGYVYIMLVIGGAQSASTIPLLAVALLITFMCAMLSASWAQAILGPIHRFLVPDRFKGGSKELFRTFHDTALVLRKPAFFAQMTALTLAWWTVVFLRPYILLVGLGVAINPFVLLFAMPVVSLIEIIPVSVLGIGTRDAGLIAVFSLLGIGAETMVAVSLMILVLSILPQVALGFALAYKRGVTLSLFTENAG